MQPRAATPLSAWLLEQSGNAAHSDAVQLAVANCIDGACPLDFIITSACSFNGSQWSLSGYLKYKCSFCEDH
jgi:hypothetical protein